MFAFRQQLRLREFLRRGPGYRRWYNLLTDSESWSTQQVEDFRLYQLRCLLRRAQSIPYYRGMFEAYGFDPQRLQSPEEIQRLPSLDKTTICRHRTQFPAGAPPWGLARNASTGGSTGAPLVFVQPLEALWAEQAFIDYMWSAVGFWRGARVAVFRGNVLHGPARLRAGNVLYLSGYHLTDRDLAGHVQALRAFRADFLHGYPSLLDHLAHFLLRRGTRLPRPPRAALCGSEAIYDYQRRRIEEAFGCPVFTWYGMSEQVALAAECVRGQGFFFFPQYSFVEFEPRSDGLFEVIGTGWLNSRFPFIRYRTGDLVSGLDLDGRSDLGIPGPKVQRIIGREQEMVRLESGEAVPFNHMIFSVHSDCWKNVLHYQFVQNEPGTIQLRVVLVDNPGPHWKESLREVFADRFTGKLKLEIEPARELTSVGVKARYFVSNVSQPTDMRDSPAPPS